MRTVTSVVLLALALVCCRVGGGPGIDPQVVVSENPLLREIEGCEELETVVRQAAFDQVRTAVIENYLHVLEGGYCREPQWADGDTDVDTDTDTDTDSDSDTSDGGDGATEYSTTNTQEVGVDEADFVKNDGSYIYLVAGNEFIIIDAWPAATADVVSRVDIEGRPRLLFLHEDHALIYSDLVGAGGATSFDGCYWDEFRNERICSVPQRRTLVTLFDVTDRERPRIERRLELDGLYVNSRRINDVVHTVMSYPELGLADVRYCPDDIWSMNPSEGDEIWLAFADLLADNEEIIEAAPLEEWIPTFSDIHYEPDGTVSASSGLVSDCHGFYEATASSGRSFLSIVSLDVLNDDEDVSVSSIIGEQGVVYASSEALYVASHEDSYGHGDWFFDDSITEATTIYRFDFDLDSPSTSYNSSGVVPGRVLNQFSMGEHRGFLRMATTVGYLPNPDCSNNVYVLEPRHGALRVVGEVTGIAPTEDIRSARFVGDRGFIVTFKKTDPLFAIDLSDPENPVIEGELHIPGYSTYMHMMDADHLLTIGFDAEDLGSFAWFQGVQLQIFDVSDMSNPTRTHIEVIGTRGTTSEATGNHLAFNYFAPQDLLAIPMAICEGADGGGSYGDEMTFNGLLVYDVTVESGFSEHGRISHGESASSYSCYNWWTDSNSQVKRSIIMDDYVFSIASDQIRVAGLHDLTSVLSSIELPDLLDDGEMYD